MKIYSWFSPFMRKKLCWDINQKNSVLSYFYLRGHLFWVTSFFIWWTGGNKIYWHFINDIHNNSADSFNETAKCLVFEGVTFGQQIREVRRRSKLGEGWQSLFTWLPWTSGVRYKLTSENQEILGGKYKNVWGINCYV